MATQEIVIEVRLERRWFYRAALSLCAMAYLFGVPAGTAARWLARAALRPVVRRVR